MKHTYTFFFSRGDSGGLKVMVMIDVFTVCRVCQDEGIQRYYQAVPFATLTAARFETIVNDAPKLASFSCPNCGTAVTRRCVVKGAAMYGFPGGNGQLRATFGATEGRVEDVSFEALRRKLDPQALPDVAVEDERDLRPDVETDHLMTICGRRFCMKSAWRALLEDDEANDGPLVEHVAKGCWFAVGPNADGVEDALEVEPDTVVVPLRDANAELELAMATGALPSGVVLPPPVASWLPAERQHELAAAALVDLRDIRKRFMATLESARMTADTSSRQGDVVVINITSPRGVVFDGEISLAAVAQLAVSSGATPRDMARYIAELVTADLLGL